MCNRGSVLHCLYRIRSSISRLHDNFERNDQNVLVNSGSERRLQLPDKQVNLDFPKLN